MSDNCFSTEKLIKLLDDIKNNIHTNEMNLESQENLWNILTWKKDTADNKELFKYLFTGWWVYTQLDIKQ